MWLLSPPIDDYRVDLATRPAASPYTASRADTDRANTDRAPTNDHISTEDLLTARGLTPTTLSKHSF